MSQRKTMISEKMLAQFYLDMCKGLLLLLWAYGLFSKATQPSTMRALFIILVPVAAVVLGFLGYEMLWSREHGKENMKNEK